MTILKRAHEELFKRADDARFSSMDDLSDHCRRQKLESAEQWQLPQTMSPTSDMTLCVADDPEFTMNDWSFTQLCRLAGVTKSTINRLSHKTASRVLQETLPAGDKPLQILTTESTVRSIHGVSYTRLWNADLLSKVRETAVDFCPPQEALDGGTGLYCGEQDLFAFLIDPTGWTEINGEAFAPGFFVWNSEVGRRSVGIQTFWFQAVCRNHIVWDAVEVVDFSRKHTANVHDGLDEIGRLIESLVRRRDTRRDRFAEVLRKAMSTRFGDDADEATKELLRRGIPRNVAVKALDIARAKGAFTIFSVVDALTQLTREIRFAGDRVDCDEKIGKLLTLAV